jgi:putative thioredoxin
MAEVKDFQKDVLDLSGTTPVLVDFWAEWCGPCKMLGPVLERLAARDAGRWVLAKVDTDRNQEIAARYGIRGIPSVKMFINGAGAAEFTGALPEYAVDQWLKKSLPDPNRETLARAESLLASGTEGAVPLLEEVIRRDAGNHRARVALAKALLSTDLARALELVEPIEADSAFYQPAEAMRTIGALDSRDPSTLPDGPAKTRYLEAVRALQSGKYEQALDMFIEVIRIDRFYDDDGARRACIAVFTLLGDDHEAARSRRRDFSSALYV